MSESNQCPAPQAQAQIDGFMKNGKVDLQKCYEEVNRRASEMDCNDFECTFERFRALATENGVTTDTSAREAITVLQGEMEGLYTNSVRENYGNGIYGPDFKVTGKGKYSHITHAEVKNPVGSEIEKAARNGYTDIVKQGNKIGDKLSKQQIKWSNATFIKTLKNINPKAKFPQTPSNTLGLVDEFDVQITKKVIVQKAVENNCANV